MFAGYVEGVYVKSRVVEGEGGYASGCVPEGLVLVCESASGRCAGDWYVEVVVLVEVEECLVVDSGCEVY